MREATRVKLLQRLITYLCNVPTEMPYLGLQIQPLTTGINPQRPAPSVITPPDFSTFSEQNIGFMDSIRLVLRRVTHTSLLYS